MNYSSHFRRTVLFLSLCLLLGLSVYGDVPSYVAWRICDFPNGTFTDPQGNFYPLADGALCFVNRFLFGTDATSEGTYTITDSISWYYGIPSPIVQYKSHGYYTKYYSGNLNALGRTNYEPGNDELFWEPEPGPESDDLFPVAVVGGYLLFVHGRLLCRTDGSTMGTECIYDFSTTYEFPDHGLFFTDMIFEGGYLYLVAGPTSGTHGLWRTDGTSEGTINLLQRSNAQLSTLAAGNGILFFSEQPSGSVRLWKTDGTVQGTQQITYLNKEDPNAAFITSSSYSNGRLWFGVYPSNGLWYSNGTIGGTKKVRTFPTRPPGYGYQLASMYAVGDRLLFTASEESLDRYLWVSDGTEQGTFKLTNADAIDGWTSVYFYGQLEESALFGADHYPNHKIWLSDGTAAGTRKLSDTVRTFISPFKYKDYYLMIGDDNDTPVGLWGLREDVPFHFLTQPRAQQHYFVGDTLHLFVEIPSWCEPAASYQWFKDNMPLEGEHSSELFIGMLTLLDSGHYFCRVTLDDKASSHDSVIANVRIYEPGTVPVSSNLALILLVLSICVMAGTSIYKSRVFFIHGSGK